MLAPSWVTANGTATDTRFKEHLPEITEALVATYRGGSGMHHMDRRPLPSREVVAAILDDFFDLLFPGYGRRQNLHSQNIAYYAGDLLARFEDYVAQELQLGAAFPEGSRGPLLLRGSGAF